MLAYKRILAAVDLGDDGMPVCRRAAELAEKYAASLTLLHVVEYVPVDLGSDLVLPSPLEVEELLLERAKKDLRELADEWEGIEVDPVVVVGTTKSEILRYADEGQVDLIVIGRHSRHGILKLLGSTANAILHNAHCDVLAVNISQ